MNDLERRTIAITGGSGFFGKSLLDYFDSLFSTENSPLILVISRGKKKLLPTEWPNLKIHLIEADVESLRPDQFPVSEVDYFIHAATSTDTSESLDFDYLYKTIYLGTRNVLSISTKLKCKAFLYVSSGAVYGLEGEKIKFSERHTSAPPTDDLKQCYGHFKRMGELLCRRHHEDTGMKIAVARCFAFIGKRLDPDGPFALTSFIKSAKEKKKITVRGSGQGIRSYMSSQDMCEWLLTLMLNNSSFDILNVGSDREMSILELGKAISEKFSCPLEVHNLPGERNNFYVPSIDKAKSKYGLGLKKPFEDALAEMISS